MIMKLKAGVLIPFWLLEATMDMVLNEMSWVNKCSQFNGEPLKLPAIQEILFDEL